LDASDRKTQPWCWARKNFGSDFLSAKRKDLETHKHAVVLHFGVYNFVRKHHSLGTTPAVAGGLEEKTWSLERVVEMTAAYCRQKEGAK